MEKMCLALLTTINNIGSQNIFKLYKHFGSFADIFSAGEGEIRNSNCVSDIVAKNIVSLTEKETLGTLADKMQSLLKEKEVKFVSFFDEDYPPLLKLIYDPPAALYVKGELPKMNNRRSYDYSGTFVSVIGSRKCTDYGLNACYMLSKELAAHDVTIVSGLARGIDSMGHRGALDGNGYTIAVLGSGVDVCYPPENKSLMEEIENSGCVISEYPLGATPEKFRFPERNRIISGLSDALLVVEAAEKSGTSITVNQALEQGREVLAVPGSIFSKYSIGTNNLIKEGATPVTCAEDVIFALKRNFVSEDSQGEKLEKKEKDVLSELSEIEKQVYLLIGYEGITVDEILLKDGSLTIQQLQFILLNFEIKGFVRRLPGQRYIRST